MKNLYENLPDTPGVYLMKDIAGRVIYVGKAGNLRRRVSSYFNHPHESRIQKLVSEIAKIDYEQTDSALEALILESKLIKDLSPRFNVKEKDDKSFLYFELTKEKFPRVILVRGKDVVSHKSKVISQFGPFPSAGNAREAYKILRRIFPWSVHETERIGKFIRPCFDYEIGLCPGTCVGRISRRDYLRNISRFKLFFGGKKIQIVRSLKREMETASKDLEFEKAEKLRRQLFALKLIHDIALINDNEVSEGAMIHDAKFMIHNFRIEGYDISNISGTSAVGSMVVFEGGKPNRDEYRKFRIRALAKPDDVGMIKEVLRRRFHNDWKLPALILIDGGRGQVNATKAVLSEFSLKTPVVGIAKGPKRKKNEFIGKIPEGFNKKILIMVRDEAHRFAISYHRKLRQDRFLK